MKMTARDFKNEPGGTLWSNDHVWRRVCKTAGRAPHLIEFNLTTGLWATVKCWFDTNSHDPIMIKITA